MKFYSFDNRVCVDVDQIRSINKDMHIFSDPFGECNNTTREYIINIHFKDGSKQEVWYNTEEERDNDYESFCLKNK